MPVKTDITGKTPSGVTKSFINEMINAAYKYVGMDDEISVAVSVVGDEEMKRLNRQYREQDKVTDVLSFAYAETLEDFPAQEVGEGKLVGEIIICSPQIRRQSKDVGRIMREEFALMLVHGALHLMGFDHSTQEEEREMFQIQHDILTEKGVI